jgi:hypothetical protein
MFGGDVISLILPKLILSVTRDGIFNLYGIILIVILILLLICEDRKRRQ